MYFAGLEKDCYFKEWDNAIKSTAYRKIFSPQEHCFTATNSKKIVYNNVNTICWVWWHMPLIQNSRGRGRWVSENSESYLQGEFKNQLIHNETLSQIPQQQQKPTTSPITPPECEYYMTECGSCTTKVSTNYIIVKN